MSWKILLLRFAGLIAFSICGGFLYAITVNLMLFANIMPEATDGEALTFKAATVWMVSICIGFIAIFIKPEWRWVFYLAPLYASSLFALIYTIIQPGALLPQ